MPNKTPWGQFSAANWADGELANGKGKMKPALRALALGERLSMLTDKHWEAIIMMAWAMKPVASEMAMRQAAAAIVITDSEDESSSEDNELYDPMFA